MFRNATIRRCCATFPSTSAVAVLTASCPNRAVPPEWCQPAVSNQESKFLLTKGSYCEETKNVTKLSSNSKGSLKKPENYEFPDDSHDISKRSAKQKLPESGSRQEFYMREDEIKMAKTTGIGIGDEKLGAYLMNALLSNSSDGNTLTGLNVSMFDLHSRRFAERLLNSGVSSLSIVETSQNEAQKAKEYAAKVRKKRGLAIGAYRANMESLFPICTRKKQAPFPAKLLFANPQLMKDSVNPLILRRNASQNDDDESGDSQKFAPIIIGSLPTANQQSNMLTSLVYNLIMHLCSLKQDTMFQYGAVRLITFLSAGNFALSICAMEPNMQFVSHGNKHKSWLLNKLFTVRPISDYSGFPRTAFSPQFPLPKSFPYEKKFDLIGIRNENLYPVTIEPRRIVRIGDLTVVNSLREDDYDEKVIVPAEILMKYAFWITFTGKITARTKVARKLREWFPKTSSTEINSLVDSDANIADLKFEDFDEIFAALYREMNDDFMHIDELRNFCAQFRPANMVTTRFAD